MAEQTALEEGRRELAFRSNDGVDIALLWSKQSNRLAVRVSDSKTGERFEVEAASDRALDVFHHPYAYAAKKAPRRRRMRSWAWGL